MGIFVFWVISAVIVGIIASSRGRSGFGWFLLACVISPILAVIPVALLPSKTALAKAAALEVPTSETHVKCPDCAELVRREARICKHCGAKLEPTPFLEPKPYHE